MQEMLSAIKLLIYENGKLIETVSRDTSTHSSQLIKSLEDFRCSANTALTTLIEQREDSDNLSDDAEEEEDEDDEAVSPKRKKKEVRS